MKRAYAWVKRLAGRYIGSHCPVHAAGLTYFVLLAMVPILCCLLVTAKLCHVDHYARTRLNERIDTVIECLEKGHEDPMLGWVNRVGSEEERKGKELAAHDFAVTARRVSDQVFSKIESFRVGTLGWLGFGLLLWTVISTLSSIETCFNEIFEVERARVLWKRILLYLMVMIVMPILSSVAVSLPILSGVKALITCTLGAMWLTRWVGDGVIWVLDSALIRFTVAYLSSAGLFTFFYGVLPNCKVRFRAAALGGLLTPLLLGLWFKLCVVAQVGIAKSSALYGSFAFLPIVLAWIYMSWQIVLGVACLVKESNA